jgi:hypothetical protein
LRGESNGAAINLTKLGIADIEDDLVAVVKDMAPLLREKPVRTLVADFISAVREAYPSAREPLRRSIAETIEDERRYWKTFSTEDLEQLHHRFEDTSLGSRLQLRLNGQDFRSSPIEDRKATLTALLRDRPPISGIQLLSHKISTNF